ncbi:MAG: TrmH family RNA methyltransferase [Cyclonatronaceae bacterium]
MDLINHRYRAELTDYMAGFVSDQKFQRMNDVLGMRTRRFVVVLEDIYHSHNASAVLRSCDCFGIQDIYTIENRNRLDISKSISMNSHKWLTIKRFREKNNDNLTSGIDQLKSAGYRIAAASPHADMSVRDLPADTKLALLFGSEKEGLSDEALQLSDFRYRIPMVGFTESFNLSVSVALSLFDLSVRLRNSQIKWYLSGEEKEMLLLEWIIKSVRAGNRLASDYLAVLQSQPETSGTGT